MGGPLESASSSISGIEDDSRFIVEWEESDPENPFNWPAWRKWMLTVTVSAISGTAGAASAVISIGYPSMEAELHCTEFQATVAFSMFPLGFALAPLLLAPVSEDSGRRPIYIISSILSTAAFAPIASATDINTVIGMRFFQGAASSTASAMVGGSIADVWKTSERGGPMSMFSFAVLAAAGIAPAIAGFIEKSLGWRWIQWIGMICSGVLAVCLVFGGCPETRGTVILAHRAKRLRKETGDLRYRTAVPLPDVRRLIWESCTRSIYFLFTEPIVISFSLWIGFAWGLIYILLDSIGLVFSELHGFTPWQIGLVYLTITVGTAIGLALNPYQEKLYRENVARIGPEARLYSACASGITFSLGCFIYAWTSYSFVPWIAPAIGITIIIASVFVIYQAVFNYLADAYLTYASSALAGQSLSRNLAGMAFPLFTRALYSHLTFRWGGTLIALIAAVLAPIPFVLFWFGPKIRARSRFASGLIVETREENGGEEGLAGDGERMQELKEEARPSKAPV